MTDGTIEFRASGSTTREAAEIVRKGIFQVMEGRHVFEHLTVEENLLAGSYTRTDRSKCGATWSWSTTTSPGW